MMGGLTFCFRARVPARWARAPLGYWLLTRTAGGYKLAFNRYEDDTPEVTRHYHDLMVIDISGPGARISETLLKFDGRKYQPASCWLTDKSKDGKRHRAPCGG